MNAAASCPERQDEQLTPGRRVFDTGACVLDARGCNDVQRWRGCALTRTPAAQALHATRVMHDLLVHDALVHDALDLPPRRATRCLKAVAMPAPSPA